MNALRRFARAAGGQSVVETAVIAPFLFALLIGVVDLGRLYRFNMIVGTSARAGAQYGAQNLTTAMDYAGMVLAAKADSQNLTGLTATATSLCTCADGSATACTATACSATHRLLYVSVTSSYTYSTLFNYHVIPQTIPLSRTVVLQELQ
jgi:Flp pilus assembly protein TadG